MKIRNFTKSRCRYVNVTAFIITINPLTTRQNLPHFCLRQILILPQISDSTIIRHDYTNHQ